MALFEPDEMICREEEACEEDLPEEIEDEALPISLLSDEDDLAAFSLSEIECNYKKVSGTEKICVPPIPDFHEVSLLRDFNAQDPDMNTPLKTYTVNGTQEFLDYDIDDIDIQWLLVQNEKRIARGEKMLCEDEFSLAFDRMEKEAVFEPSSTIPCEGDDVCAICMDGEATDVNQILYCDMCNIPVHQDCYGVPEIPEGQWFCRKCTICPSDLIHCDLCVLQSGAMKLTSDGRWAHVMCALWLPEISFRTISYREPMEGVVKCLHRRNKLKCTICKMKGGACIQCSKRSCVRSFHVTCAAQAGLEMETDEDNEDKRRAFCHLHGKSTVDKKEFEEMKKKAIEAIRSAKENGMDSGGLATVYIPQLSQEARKRIEELVGEDIDELLAFWYYKRRKRGGAPLIRRLQIRSQVSQPSRRTSHDVDESIALLAHYKGRATAERVRLLCDMTKKRERNKNQHLSLSYDLFCSVFPPIEVTIKDTLTNIILLDDYEVFTQPVEVEGYSEVITNPIDLFTMGEKNERGEYDSIDDLKADLDLMFRNCSAFNSDKSIFLNYGKKMKKKVDIVLGRVDAYIKELESDEILSEVLKINFSGWNDELDSDDALSRKRKSVGNDEEREDNGEESTHTLPKKAKLKGG